MRHSTILLAVVAAWAACPSLGRAQFGPTMDPRQATYYMPEGGDPGLMPPTGGMGGMPMGAMPMPESLPGYGYGPAGGYGYEFAPAEDMMCCDGSCGQCGRCCKHMDVWGSVETFIWWAQGSHVPPLVTTSPPGTPREQAGVLGQPDTEILLGQQYLGDGVQVGGRVMAGIWLDECHDVSLAGRFYGLGGDTKRFFRESPGTPTLARPFFDVTIGQQASLPIAFTDPIQGDVLAGSISSKYVNNNFLGAEAFLQIMMQRECRRRVDLIAGYQFMRQDDLLQIESTSTVTGGDLPVGLQVDLFDQFSTQNKFHGGSFGVRARMAHGCWSLDCISKMAVGVNHQFVQIEGERLITLPPGPGTASEGGFLALPSNIGEYDRYKLCAIPELTLNLTHHVTCNCSLHVGYTMIMWSNLVTSGKQVDLGLDFTQLAGPPAERPRFDFDDQRYWLQGLNFGLNWDF